MINYNMDILYVEDDEIDAETVLREFKAVNERLTIDVARDGEEALDKLYGRHGKKKIHPKVILIDLDIPKVNGIELIKKLRESNDFNEVAMYILTGAYASEDKIAIQNMNVKGHLIKPFQYGDALEIFWVIEKI